MMHYTLWDSSYTHLPRAAKTTCATPHKCPEQGLIETNSKPRLGRRAAFVVVEFARVKAIFDEMQNKNVH
jgi:hypothetical protein